MNQYFGDPVVQAKLVECGLETGKTMPAIDSVNRYFIIPGYWFTFPLPEIIYRLRKGAFWPGVCTGPVIGRDKEKCRE